MSSGDEYERLAAQLRGIQGCFMMSMNDTPFIREAFAGFRIDEVDTTWTLSSASAGRAMRVTELIVSNQRR